MGEIERSQVAELIVDRALAGARRGSGYLVSAEVVLTAAHVVGDAVSVTVRFNADRDDEWTSEAEVAFADPASDVGAVTLTSPSRDVVSGAQFGALGGRAAVVPFTAVGFPRFKLRSEHPPDMRDAGSPVVWYRDSAQPVGTIASLANFRQGSLELVTDPPERDPDPEHSPWEGISGAAVWCSGRIVGVVSEHHRSDGLGRLAATPFSTASRQLGPSDGSSSSAADRFGC